MTIGVVSDTHMPRFGECLPAELERGLRAAKVELIVHCGDFTALEVAPLFERIAPLEAVAGNNDPPEVVRRFGRQKILTIEGRRVGIVHGDGRKPTPVQARATFAHDQVDAILFGHSHVPMCEHREGIWLINPGSPTDKRRMARYSYALIELSADSLVGRLEFFDRPRGQHAC